MTIEYVRVNEKKKKAHVNAKKKHFNLSLYDEKRKDRLIYEQKVKENLKSETRLRNKDVKNQESAISLQLYVISSKHNDQA